jgi:hypothetical protein
MIYLFILGVAALGTALYLLIMYSSIPGAVDERLGALEALPDHLDEWIADQGSPEGQRAAAEGLVRESRVIHIPAQGIFGRERFATQVRYRSVETQRVVRVEPETRVARKRRVIK